MAPPTRSNTLSGLPSSPSPRARSLPRVYSPDIIPRSNSTTGFRPKQTDEAPPLPPLRHQLSLSSVHSSSLRLHQERRLNRIPPPPLPVSVVPIPLRPNNVLASLQWNGGSSASISSVLSAESSSSSTSLSSYSSSTASSLFSNGTPLSSSSSTTSLEGKKVAIALLDTSPYGGESENPLTTPVGFSSSIWHRLNKVAEIAGQLSHSFSKTMETSAVAHANDENTPDDEQSSHSRDIKDNETSKAQEPSDVLDWFFEERDLGFNGGLTVANPSPHDEVPSTPPSPPPAPRKALPPVPESPPTSWNQQLLPQYSRKGSVDSGILNVGTAVLDPSKRNMRVRFVEQVHPRRMGSMSVDEGYGGFKRVTSPPASMDLGRTNPRFRVELSSPEDGTFGGGQVSFPRRMASLSNVDIRGRRLAVGGLPSNVRPQRPQRPM